ncbi:unnamed protein product [Lampetra fluviatilis]
MRAAVREEEEKNTPASCSFSHRQMRWRLGFGVRLGAKAAMGGALLNVQPLSHNDVEDGGVLAPQLECLCSVLAPQLECLCSVLAPQLECLCSVLAPQLECLCSVLAPQLECLCSVLAPQLECLCSVLAPQLECLCSVLAPQLECLCSVLAPRWRAGAGAPQSARSCSAVGLLLLRCTLAGSVCNARLGLVVGWACVSAVSSGVRTLVPPGFCHLSAFDPDGWGHCASVAATSISRALWALFTSSVCRSPLQPQVLQRLQRGGERLPCPPSCPRALYELMLCCWRLAPHQRPPLCRLEGRVAQVQLRVASAVSDSPQLDGIARCADRSSAPAGYRCSRCPSLPLSLPPPLPLLPPSGEEVSIAFGGGGATGGRSHYDIPPCAAWSPSSRVADRDSRLPAVPPHGHGGGGVDFEGNGVGGDADDAAERSLDSDSVFFEGGCDSTLDLLSNFYASATGAVPRTAAGVCGAANRAYERESVAALRELHRASLRARDPPCRAARASAPASCDSEPGAGSTATTPSPGGTGAAEERPEVPPRAPIPPLPAKRNGYRWSAEVSYYILPLRRSPSLGPDGEAPPRVPPREPLSPSASRTPSPKGFGCSSSPQPIPGPLPPCQQQQQAALSSSPQRTMPPTQSFGSDPKFSTLGKEKGCCSGQPARGPCILPIIKDGKKQSSTHYYLLPEKPAYLDRYERFLRESDPNERSQPPTSEPARTPEGVCEEFSRLDSLSAQEQIRQVLECVHGVTTEECHAALHGHAWDVPQAIHYLKIEQLLSLGLASRAECQRLLERFDSNLEQASSFLLESCRTLRHRRRGEPTATTEERRSARNGGCEKFPPPDVKGGQANEDE